MGLLVFGLYLSLCPRELHLHALSHGEEQRTLLIPIPALFTRRTTASAALQNVGVVLHSEKSNSRDGGVGVVVAGATGAGAPPARELPLAGAVLVFGEDTDAVLVVVFGEGEGVGAVLAACLSLAASTSLTVDLCFFPTM
jgi:hypothetical protein